MFENYSYSLSFPYEQFYINNVPATKADIIKSGFIPGDTKLFAGYIPKNIPAEQTPVYIAQGRRKGQLFTMEHAEVLTRYYIRQYWIRKEV